MKLSAQQLTQHLVKNLKPIYVVSGDDPFLLQETLDLIRETAKKAGYSERIRINVESNTQWGEALFAQAQSLSLFATKRLLELDLTVAKLNAANSKILQEYANHLADDTILLVQSQKLDARSEKSQWFKALDQAGVMVQVWPIPIDQLPAWISQRAKKIDLNLTKSAAEFLAAQVEGNLLAAAQELEKLRLLQTTEVIDHKILENMISDSAHFDIFALVDSALAGQGQRSLRILNNLAAEDVEPTLILWALTRELRTMADIAKKIQQGQLLSTLFSQFRIWTQRQGNVRAFLQRHNQQNCWKLLSRAAEVDRMIKGATSGDVWNELQGLVLKML